MEGRTPTLCGRGLWGGPSPCLHTLAFPCSVAWCRQRGGAQQQGWWRRTPTETRTSVHPPPQLPGPWGAASRRRAVWHLERGNAVGRCAGRPEGTNLPGMSAGRDPFWAVLDPSRFSWPEVAAEKHEHMAVSRDVAATSLTSASILKTNSLKTFGILAGKLCLSAQQLLTGTDGTGPSDTLDSRAAFQGDCFFFHLKSLQACDLQLCVVVQRHNIAHKQSQQTILKRWHFTGTQQRSIT